MSGKPITQQQVKLYMSNRNQPDQSQVSAAAKAGLSERSARRIDSGEHKLHKPPRKYRTRKDPFEGLFTHSAGQLPVTPVKKLTNNILSFN
jgi:hypothetical protein